MEGGQWWCGNRNGPTTVHFLTEPMHVWTSRALESNNCSLDVSKHGVLLALCRAESPHLMVKGRFKTCSGLWRPWDFLHHELIVYFIPHFFLVSISTHISETSRTPIKTIIPRWENLSPLYVSLLSRCLTPFTGPFCLGRWNMCHLPLFARLAVGLVEHVLRDSDSNWRGLYIIWCRKRGWWPLINTIFTHWAEKDKADSIFETLPFSSLVRYRKQRKATFFSLMSLSWHWLHEDVLHILMNVIIIMLVWWQQRLVLWLCPVITATIPEFQFYATFDHCLTHKPCGECRGPTATPC